MKRILAVTLVLMMAATPAVLAAPQVCPSMTAAPGLSMAMAMHCCAPEACGDCRMQESPTAPMAAEALSVGPVFSQLSEPASKAAGFLPDRQGISHETDEKQAPDSPQKLYDLYSDYRI